MPERLVGRERGGARGVVSERAASYVSERAASYVSE